jgi:hypothetical protein
MSKALDEVFEYSNEDEYTIRKHWIIFVFTALKVILRTAVVLFVYNTFELLWLEIADMLNDFLTIIPFSVRDYLFLIILFILIAWAIKDFVITYAEYTSVSLTINNIRIKGNSGIFGDVAVNSSLENLVDVSTDCSLLGNLFNYAGIRVQISAGAYVTEFKIKYMADAKKFLDVVLYYQEAQKEGRNIRAEERRERTLDKQTDRQIQAQIQLMQAQTMAQVEAISGIAQAIQGKNQEALGENGEKIPIPEVSVKQEADEQV